MTLPELSPLHGSIPLLRLQTFELLDGPMQILSDLRVITHAGVERLGELGLQSDINLFARFDVPVRDFTAGR
jgi:hypothetical protein